MASNYDPTHPITRPWQPPYTSPGQLDFFRIHAYALDRLGDVLATFLPHGAELPGAYYVGSHPDRPILVRVCLLGGAWNEAETGQSGRDLVSLIAHLFGMSQAQAARKLSAWLGIAAVAHA